jgi:putative CocE/NonD family hydrolase
MGRRFFGIRIFVILFLCLILTYCGGNGGGEAPVTKISSFGKYEGYSEPLYTEFVRSSQYVTVRDGTKLAVDIYRPAIAGNAVDKPYPAIFMFTPYRRAYYDSQGKLVLSAQRVVDYMTKYGYVIVVGEVRGTGSSFGVRRAMNDRTEAQDAYDLIEWIARQPWCDGKVGMYGSSYYGQTVFEALSTMPPHLKAASISVTDFNKYDGWVRGGIARMSAAILSPGNVPVDEDKDGSMLAAAIAEQKNNGPGLTADVLKTIPYRDSWDIYSDGYYWIEVSASTYLDEFKRGGVPVYFKGGFYDFLRRDAFTAFANWPNPKKLVVGPWRHGEFETTPEYLIELHRWFDYWLKGIDNGIMKEPPIYYYTINADPGNEWTLATAWPPERQDVIYFLHGGPSGTVTSINDGLLKTSAPTSTGQDSFTVVYDIASKVDILSTEPIPSGKPGTEFDLKGLTYTSEPLAADLKVTGHPFVVLWIASDTTDADVFVILEDVAEDGTSTYVTDGRLRLSMRATYEPPYDFLGLPWHRCFKEDERPLTPNTPYRVTIDLMPTSYVFKKGHRIRIAVNGSQGRLVYFKPDIPYTMTIYREKVRPSYVVLPNPK